MKNIALLKKFSPFNEFEDRFLEKAAQLLSTVTHRKGDMLFKRGKNVETTYFLIDGSVNLIDNAFNKLEVIPGCDRAMRPLNDTSPTKVSAIAAGAIRLLTINTAELNKLLVLNSEALAPSVDDSFDTGIYNVADSMMVEEVDQTDWMSSLLQSPLFSSIAGKSVQELFLRLEDYSAQVGDKIIHEGKPGDYFYVLTSGRARVYNSSESVNATLEPGAYFGEEALLANTTRNATVEMLTPGCLKRLSYDDFISLLKAPVLEYINDKDLEAIDTPYEIIDVKMPIEFRFQHLKGSKNIPLSRLRAQLNQLDGSKLFLINGDVGSRADVAAHLFCQAGLSCKIIQRSDIAESA